MKRILQYIFNVICLTYFNNLNLHFQAQKRQKIEKINKLIKINNSIKINNMN